MKFQNTNILAFLDMVCTGASFTGQGFRKWRFFDAMDIWKCEGGNHRAARGICSLEKEFTRHQGDFVQSQFRGCWFRTVPMYRDLFLGWLLMIQPLG